MLVVAPVRVHRPVLRPTALVSLVSLGVLVPPVMHHDWRHGRALIRQIAVVE